MILKIIGVVLMIPLIGFVLKMILNAIISPITWDLRDGGIEVLGIIFIFIMGFLIVF